MLPPRNIKIITDEFYAPQSLFFYDPENEIFFLITSEISKLGLFVYFIYCQSVKAIIPINLRVPYN